MVDVFDIDQLSVTANNTTQTRTLGQRFATKLNVLDFGADPTGATDSTNAIQNCLNAAFGPYNAPHGGVPYNGTLNKFVDFPNGNFRVSPPISAQAITNVAAARALTATISSASPAVVTVTSHGIANGAYIHFTNSGGTLPTGLLASTVYTADVGEGEFNTFRVKLSGTLVNTSSTGTGTHTVRTGEIRITTASTSPLVNGDMVYIRGVGGTTFANLSCEIHNVTATTFDVVDGQWNNFYTSGGTWCPPCLKIRSVHGGRIVGTGMGSTGLATDVDNCAVISTNGMQYSWVEGIYFAAGDGGIGFDLNLGTASSGVNLQSNSFVKCGFGGGPSTRADYGCAVGFGQEMGSENTWFWCNFSGTDIAGLYIHNQNSLDNTVFGGNIAANVVGILINGGSCPWIHGISFQNYADPTWWDIVINNSQGDAYTISGCRSESYRFLKAPVGMDQLCIHISGCSHLAGIHVDSIFYRGNADTTIDGCRSVGGYLGGAGRLTIFNAGGFKNPNYLRDVPDSENYSYLEVHPQRVITQATSRSMTSTDGSAKIQFTNTTDITYTIVTNNDSAPFCRLGVGSKVELQRCGTGEVTIAVSGVTIRCSVAGRRLGALNAVAFLFCDGVDTWTLTGDLKV